ncbi:MAG: ATP phosphoribosyltransferase, partial [Thermus sp.]
MKRFALTVALPKGRMFQEAYEALRQAGLELPSMENQRALLHGKEGGIALLELRNKDVPVYVDLGIADIGVVGKDVLLDSGRDLFEPVDLGFGACRLSLIRRPGDTSPIRRIATKYPLFTARLLKERGWVADVVELSGNIELAAV